MKCKILHETKGRMRIHFCQNTMSISQADIADAYFKSIKGIDDVKVYERTSDLIIYYSFERAKLISILSKFSFENDDVKALKLSVRQGKFSVNTKKTYYDRIYALRKKTVFPCPFKTCNLLYQSSQIHI